MEDLDLPIALRRGRRCSARPNVKSEESPSASVIPQTPHGRKRGVRHSDPGPSINSSGLTPMVRRSCIATPKTRRSAAPTRSVSGRRLVITTPSSAPRPNGKAEVLNLHHTVEGRVERRMRRNGLRDMLNKFEQEKRRKEQSAQAQIAKLKAEVKARDREIYELQNATVIVDTDRIWGLEQQIDELKDELARRSLAQEAATQYYSWVKASSDAPTNDLMDMTPDEDHFGDTTLLQLQASTPTRARSSFLTPPSTSPPMPASPCSREVSPTPTSHVDLQMHLSDLDKQLLGEEIASLQFEVHKLTATLDSYNALGARIRDALSNGPPVAGEAFLSLEAIENQVQLLLQTMSDRAAAVAHLTAAISELGFPGDDASEMIVSLASGFRAARLELEYLTPGEITLPLTSHGAEVLDLLLTRLRTLAKQAKEDEDSIDEYHEIEQSLRKQLDTRISVMDELNAKIAEAYRKLDEKDNRIRELEVGNNRLKGAVDGYVRDITELERLVERMESEQRESTHTHAAQQKSNEELLAVKDVTIAELEAKIEEAFAQTAELLNEMSAIEVSLTRRMTTMRRQHGAILTVRDARVSELRDEVDRVNESLRVAHGTIHALRVENSGLKGQMEEEKKKAKDAMDSMKEELHRVLHLSQSFLDEPSGASTEFSKKELGDSRTITRSGGFLARNSSRRGSKASRRRYDSGLELLNEDEIDI
ncbi:glycolipid 2-alpha-mannosyltransferase [Trichoderma arundinaceum]|uniref:Glycolipid 2-alpha-mannosyltransferase n=1 Tax=Trichoderma arundinaceum TaxID=490622 RepID=A0A395NQ93_TRIAR|nr:glycolipid 2-alpha-mannosyltransferase [Trichoderma arundinaceum]